MAVDGKYMEALKLTPGVLANIASNIYVGADDASIISRYNLTRQQLSELREWWHDELHELFQWSINEADSKYGRARWFSLGYAEGVTKAYIQVYGNIRKHPDYHKLNSLLTWRELMGYAIGDEKEGQNGSEHRSCGN